MTSNLPPGTSEPLVIDDFGDVFGVLFAVTGDGFSYQDLKDYVDYLRRELVLIDGVARIDVRGVRDEQVFVEISQSRLATLGIPINRIYELLRTQNVVSNAGDILAGTESVRIHPTGEFEDVSELEQMLISEAGAKELIYLGDVADVYRGYAEVPSNLMGFGGDRALVVGVSFTKGVNVVDVGERIISRVRELEYALPIGINLHPIYVQPEEVSKSVLSFMINLIAAVVIVVVVLLIFMGLKSGLLTMQTPFGFMALLGMLSLSGMLIKNGIVLVDQINTELKEGTEPHKAVFMSGVSRVRPVSMAAVTTILGILPRSTAPPQIGLFKQTHHSNRRL